MFCVCSSLPQRSTHGIASPRGLVARPVSGFKLCGMQDDRLILRRALRVARRATLLVLTALACGFGGGLGELASGIRKVTKPERENPIVCVAGYHDERT